MSSPRRSGRRPGDSGTRAAILDAAREAFASRTYQGATIRSIAATAGVDPALVLHYFGSKHGLFAAAMELPFTPREVLPALLEGDPEGAGRRLAAFFLGAWDDEGRRGQLLGLVRAAVSDPQAAALFRDFLERDGPGPALAAHGVDDASLRAGLAAAQLVGLAVTRHVIGLEPIASMPRDELADVVGPTLQRYLTGSL